MPQAVLRKLTAARFRGQYYRFDRAGTRHSHSSRRYRVQAAVDGVDQINDRCVVYLGGDNPAVFMVVGPNPFPGQIIRKPLGGVTISHPMVIYYDRDSLRCYSTSDTLLDES